MSLTSEFSANNVLLLFKCELQEQQTHVVVGSPTVARNATASGPCNANSDHKAVGVGKSGE